MKRDERKRKFNEAIVNMLYPSPPQPDPSPPQFEQELEPLEALIEGSGTDVISGTLDDYENASTSGEEHNSETEKLTRAQRKKIRKKKLKEEAIRRGKLIGPLLPLTLNPTSECECDREVAEDAPAVRSNASEEGSGADEPGDYPLGISNYVVDLTKTNKWPRYVLSDVYATQLGLGDDPACGNSNKMKHRRMAKKLAKEKQIASTLENCNPSSISSSAVDRKEAHM